MTEVASKMLEVESIDEDGKKGREAPFAVRIFPVGKTRLLSSAPILPTGKILTAHGITMNISVNRDYRHRRSYSSRDTIPFNLKIMPLLLPRPSFAKQRLQATGRFPFKAITCLCRFALHARFFWPRGCVRHVLGRGLTPPIRRQREAQED